MHYLPVLFGILLTLVGAQAVGPPVSRAVQTTAFFTSFADCPRGTHENVFVEVEGKFISMLGRGYNTIATFDMSTDSWSEVDTFDFGAEVHHCQAVSWRGSVIIGGCLKGSYPTETPLSDIYQYYPNTNEWEVVGRFPEDRDRGSTALVTRRGKFYFINGGRGHKQGPETTTNMFDEFDPRTGQWTTLPDTPRVRDHGGAIYFARVDEIFVAGGRWGGQASFFEEQYAYKEIDVYSFVDGAWRTLEETLQVGHPGNTPTRSTRFFVICGGEIEQDTTDPSLCEFFNMENKTMVRTDLGLYAAERHGTGFATCSSNHNIICTSNGASRDPTNTDLTHTECMFTNGEAAICEPSADYW